MADPNPADFGAVPDPAAFGGVALPELDTAKANASLAKTVVHGTQQAGQTVADMATLYAPIETALNVTSGMLLGFPAYLGGGVGTLIARGLGLSEDDPKEIAKKFSEAVTFQPITQAGKRLTETALLPLTALMEGSEAAGKKVTDVTGSPVAGALTEATIQMLPAPVIGSLGRRLAGKVPTAAEAQETAHALAGEPSEAIGNKIAKVYEETGIDPPAVYEAGQVDPTILQDLASSNRPVPESLKRQALGGPKVEKPAEPETPALAGGEGKPPEEPPTTERPPESPEPTDPQKAILDRIVPGDAPSRWPTLSQIYTRVVDRLNPIKQAEIAAQGEVAKAGPYSLERLTAGMFGKVRQFIDFGTYDFDTYKTTGKSYTEVLRPVENDLDGFRAYMVARRAIEQEGKGLETGVPMKEAQAVVEQGRAKYEGAFQDRLKYKDSLVDMLVKSGVLSEKSAAAMREANKAHVPFYRLFEDQTQPSGASRVRNPIKRFTGSERQIIDPIESDIKDTALFISLAEKNAARQAFVKLGPDFAEKVKNPVAPIRLQESEIRALFDEFVTSAKKTSKTRVSEKTSTTGSDGAAQPGNKIFETNKKRVKDALTARGFSDNEAEIMMNRLAMSAGKDSAKTVERVINTIEKTEYVPSIDIRVDSDVATIFRAQSAAVAKDEMAVFHDGKRSVYKVDPDVAEAFNGTDRQTANMLTNILSTPASLLRTGVTTDLAFAGKNLIRDAVSSFLYTGSHPIKTIKGAISLFGKDEAFQNWLKGGGANATMVAMDRNYIQQHLYSLNAEVGAMQKTWNVIKTPYELLRVTSEVLENITRIGAVRDELMVAKSKAQIQALSMISREATVDFARKGSDPVLQNWSRMTAFMNPGIQGIDRMARALKENPLGTTAKALASITLPSMLLWWANHDDQWKDPATGQVINRWQETPDWEKDLFWIVLTENHTFRIPKDFQWGIIFGSLPERLLDKYFGDKPDAFKNFSKSLMNGFQVNMIPTVAAPIAEQITNHNFFTDRPLIPSHLEKLLPEYQYTPYTTEATKALGHLVGALPGMHDKGFASPIVIDNYIRGWTGTLGTYAVEIADAALRKSGQLPDPIKPSMTLADIPIIKAFVIRHPSASAQSIADFHDHYNEAKLVVDTVHYLAREGDATAMQREMMMDTSKLVKLDGIQTALAQSQNLVQLIYKNPQIDADQKRQLIDTVYGQMITMARAGNEELRQVKQALGGHAETVH